jgi:hypothetical protein
MKTMCTLLVTLIALTSSAVHAAEPSHSTFPQPAQSPPLVQDHASTLHEGFFRGIADGIRASGEFNYNTAAASLILEEARKAAYANEFRHAETFWAKRALWESQMAARKGRPLAIPQSGPSIQPTPAVQPATQPTAQPVATQVAVPAIDPGQPGFAFPYALNHPIFAAGREKLAALFASRSPLDSGPSSASYIRITNVTAEMRSSLSEMVRELPPMAYLEGRKFLDQVDYSAAQVVQIKVAAN